MTKKDTRNAEKTRTLILNTAEKIFAEKGFAKTTINEIATECQTSNALIIFHFKNKKNLYSEVKAAIIHRYVNAKPDTMPVPANLEDTIREITGKMFEFYRNNPRMIRLSNWELLEDAAEPWPGEDELHHSFIALLQNLQQTNQLRNDLSPMHILIMICGSIHIWWEYHSHFVMHLSNHTHPVTDHDNMYLEKLNQFIIRGLKTT